MTIGPIGFAAPWLLLALIALPILWLILRAIPPAPVRRLFPGVALLLGLTDEESVSDRTPWWLLLLRMLAVAAVIIGLAGPVLNPDDKTDAGNGPLLILLDGTWASARDWDARANLIDGILAQAGRDGRTAAVMRLTDVQPPSFRPADAWRSRLPGFAPLAWEPTQEAQTQAAALLPDTAFDTYWMSDGLDRPGRAELLRRLENRGEVTIYESARALFALRPPVIGTSALELTALRARAGNARDIMIEAHGRDPSGIMRVLARLPMTFDTTETQTTAELSLPSELRARVTHFAIAGARSAGATAITDDSLRRREVALIGTRQEGETLDLLSPLFYLRKALITNVDLVEGALTDILPANPDVIVLADVASLSDTEQAQLADWVDSGGLLLRFAGPRLAASDISRTEEAPLMPVRLRAGGRNVGGAMSWGEPKTLAPFDRDSPFSGLNIPADVTVSSQVMAQPDPNLAQRVIARLSDETPVVTRKAIGQGQVVLFHVTANAEWSTLPLSGLFVQMLERLSVSSAAAKPEVGDLAGLTWQPIRVITATGQIEPAGTLPGVAGDLLANDPVGPTLHPGLYQTGDRSFARNIISNDQTLTPVTWPARLSVQGLARAKEQALGGWLLGLALILLALDVLATLALSGRLFGTGGTRRSGRVAGLALGAMLTAAALSLPDWANAQSQGQSQSQTQGQSQSQTQIATNDTDSAAPESDRMAILATSELALGHVLTGDAALDDMAQAGMRGLGQVLNFRTSVEPAAPMGVNLETDVLAFFPFLYWPISPDQPIPSDQAYDKLNRYLRGGGMILFDTRDSDLASFGSATANGRKLQRLAAPLDIPALEPIPEDHVLTRTFYLLQDFPGRHPRGTIWVEAATPGAELIEGMPFRNLNDGVTPVVIGGNDWAAAWAVGDTGAPLVPIGRGFAGERQREISLRFGVNLIMHVLTGNYKSDQVHVPALLDRLGQ